MRCPKFWYPGQIIVLFDELELILYVNQGLTLSTASLVSLYHLLDLEFIDRDGYMILSNNIQDYDVMSVSVIVLKPVIHARSCLFHTNISSGFLSPQTATLQTGFKRRVSLLGRSHSASLAREAEFYQTHCTASL